MNDWVASSFFDREVAEVARDLIGRDLLVGDIAEQAKRATIVETEAYGDASDPASHAAFRPGGNAALMAGPPGSVYVYLAYGMYPCLNFVTGPVGVASAVLIRGVWLVDSDRPTLGPGRSTRALGVDAGDHGELIPGKRFAISKQPSAVFSISTTPRIGITRGVDIPWRFVADLA